MNKILVDFKQFRIYNQKHTNGRFLFKEKNMKRKYDSKKTIDKILSVSQKLFNEKGYENTSIQDIVNSLEMSKGAIFHHFKSKEDIFNAVMNKQVEDSKETISKIIEDMAHLTAKEKLINLLDLTLNNKQLHSLDNIYISKMESPHFVLAHMKDSVNNNAPIFARIMYEGIEDGSLSTEFPDECSEAFFLLINIWCDPIIFSADISRIEKRLRFIQSMMKKMGADILDDKMLNKCINFIKELRREI